MYQSCSKLITYLGEFLWSGSHSFVILVFEHLIERFFNIFSQPLLIPLPLHLLIFNKLISMIFLDYYASSYVHCLTWQARKIWHKCCNSSKCYIFCFLIEHNLQNFQEIIFWEFTNQVLFTDFFVIYPIF